MCKLGSLYKSFVCYINVMPLYKPNILDQTAPDRTNKTGFIIKHALPERFNTVFFLPYGNFKNGQLSIPNNQLISEFKSSRDLSPVTGNRFRTLDYPTTRLPDYDIISN